ncbi:MAG: hypothetical protein KIT25_08415 [Enhydrobacter sp.]|nr:MAG: hypothetical protein KIT25_08415 [Enhydrobacter sp.]
MTRKFLLLAVVAAMSFAAVPVAVANTAWALAARAALNRIHHMQEGTHDFAAVIIEAPAGKIYEVALEHARQNRSLMILMQDPIARRLQVAEGDRTATLHVVEFSPQVSQLMIAGTARPGEGGTASRVVAAALRICAEMKKECQLERR